MTFNEIIEFRKSNRKFDPSVPVPPEVMEEALHHATLAPNSSNMQLWEFHWMHSEQAHQKTVENCLSQMAARSAQELVVFVTRRDLWRMRVKWHMDLIAQDAERLGDPNARSIKLRSKYYGQLMPLSYMNDGLGLLGLFRRTLTFFIGLARPIVRGEGHAGQRITVHKSCALAAENFMLSIAAQGFHSCPMEGFDAKRLKRQLGLPRGAEINMVIAVGKGMEDGFWGPRRRVDPSEVIIKH
ncbi:MAG: hypothetical protein RL754_1069 [Bacteroidota bacterium]|jgi:nitroreductase